MEYPEQTKDKKQLQEAGWKRLPNGREVWVDENGDFEVPHDDPIVHGGNEVAPFAGELPSYKLTLEVTGQGHPGEAIRSLGSHPSFQDLTQQSERQNPNVWSLGELQPYTEPGEVIPAEDANNHLARFSRIKDYDAQEFEQEASSRRNENQEANTPPYSPETGKRNSRRAVKLISWLVIGLVAGPPAVRLANGGEAAAKACNINPLCIAGEAWGDVNPFNYWPLGHK
jgi:hypothetical protein